MARKPFAYGVVFGALILSACLEDITVGLDTQPLVDDDGRDGGDRADAAQDRDGGPANMDDGAVIIISDGGPSFDGGVVVDAGPCTPDECPVEIQIVEDAPCPGGAPRVCARAENALCALLCPPPTSDLRCGGVHRVPGTEFTCGDETFCLHEVGSCDATEMGTCAAIPTSCTKDDEPVCGCDGNTYGNACQAHHVGVNLRSLGACP